VRDFGSGTWTLYHRTSADVARAIQADGFRNGRGSYLTSNEYEGVWLSDQPLDINEGAAGDTLLRVVISCTDDELGLYEWVEEGKPYREFLVPDDWLNSRCRVIIERVDPLD